MIRARFCLRVFALLALASPAARAADWPQFLGPQRNGISAETGLVNRWPAAGLKPLWRVPGGVGMAGLAIHQDRLYTMVQKDNQQVLIALDAQRGTPLWETTAAPAYTNTMGDGPRATPTVAGGRVFVFSGEGILTAVNAADGEMLWQTKALEELEGSEADYGMACSPLVVGDQVIVTLGAPQAAVAAFDTAAGKLTWKSGDDPAGYSSPALLDIGGQAQIVAFTGASALGLTPTTGDVLWRFPFETDFGCNIATPIAHQGQVFISSGENHGCALLSIKPKAGESAVDVVWSSLGSKSVLRNEWQTSILLDGYLYGFDNVGAAGPVSHLTCVDAATGKRLWQEARFGKGNMISADGKLFIVTIDGELAVAIASPKGYQELGRTQVVGKTRQAPALANGLLYLRDDEEIVCLDVRAK